jgi:hypothetical protein
MGESIFSNSTPDVLDVRDGRSMEGTAFGVRALFSVVSGCFLEKVERVRDKQRAGRMI